MPRGGVRKGAGRPPGSGRFGERSSQIWVPDSLLPDVWALLEQHLAMATERRARRPRSGPVHIAMPPPEKVRVDGPVEARDQLQSLAGAGVRAAVVMLDPSYRQTNARGRADYVAEMLPLIALAGEIADHVFVWGFPLTLARIVDLQSPRLSPEAWITWCYMNSVSRRRGWRQAQQSVLHLRRQNAKMHYDAFLTPQQRQAHTRGKLPYLLTQRDVIVEPLLSGFIRRGEQTGFRLGQKPLSVIEPLLRMTARPGDLVIDPTAGSGTTGEVAVRLGCAALLSDRSTDSLKICRRRLREHLLA